MMNLLKFSEFSKFSELSKFSIMITHVLPPLPSDLLLYLFTFLSLPDRLGLGASRFERKLVSCTKDRIIRQNMHTVVPTPPYYCEYRSWNRCLKYIFSYAIRGKFYIYRRSTSDLMAKIYVRENKILVRIYHQWNDYSKQLEIFLQQTELFESIPLSPYSLSTYTFEINGSFGEKEMRWKYFQNGADIHHEIGLEYIAGVYGLNVASIGENAVLREAVTVVDHLNNEWKKWKKFKKSKHKTMGI